MYSLMKLPMLLIFVISSTGMKERRHFVDQICFEKKNIIKTSEDLTIIMIIFKNY